MVDDGLNVFEEGWEKDIFEGKLEEDVNVLMDEDAGWANDDKGFEKVEPNVENDCDWLNVLTGCWVWDVVDVVWGGCDWEGWEGWENVEKEEKEGWTWEAWDSWDVWEEGVTTGGVA